MRSGTAQSLYLMLSFGHKIVDGMDYSIDYCCINLMGRVRQNNEDNFFVQGRYRREEETLNDIVVEGRFPPHAGALLAVYDGMGGESCGEVASLIAAEESAALMREGEEAPLFLQKLCARINRRICAYASQNSVGCMGSTAAVALFDPAAVYLCNLGDSRIYKTDATGLKQLSYDHVLRGYPRKKAPLTQHLGIPEEELLIEPYIVTELYRPGDRYLLCSDGITDMLTDDKIYQIVSQPKAVTVCARELVDAALKNGGIDNITVIVCEVQKKRSLWQRLTTGKERM